MVESTQDRACQCTTPRHLNAPQIEPREHRRCCTAFTPILEAPPYPLWTATRQHHTGESVTANDHTNCNPFQL